MPFPVACGCGQKFMAQDHLSGKQVPCPACGNPLLIQPPAEAAPAPSRPAAKPPAARPQAAARPEANIPPIAVRCGCGKAYKASAAMRGKSLQCPACGQNVPIPLHAPAAAAAPAAADPFGAGANPLGGDLFGADPFGGAPLGNDPLGGDLFGSPLGGGPLGVPAMGGPLGVPMAGAPQPSPAHYGAPQVADDGGGNTKLLVILGVGVGVVLVGLFVGIWMINRNKTPAIANNPSTTEITNSNSTTPPSIPPSTTTPETTTPTGPTIPEANGGTNPMGTNPMGASPMGQTPSVDPAANGGVVGTTPTSPGVPGTGNGGTSPTPMGPMPMGVPGTGTPGTTPGLPGAGGPGNTGSSGTKSGDDPPASRPIGKVLGVGLATAHPTGKIVGVRVVGDPESLKSQYSWMQQILPFVGHQDLYDKFDINKPWGDKENLQLCATVIPEFLNPADDRLRWKGYPFENFALTHFVGMSGIEDARNVVAAKLPRSDPRAGVFGYDAIATPAEITDGTSNTIMVLGGGELASPWIMGGGAAIRGAREPHFDKITGFGSKGTSGVTVLMADGSVRVVSSNINPAVFRALSTIHGGEKIALDTDAPLSTDK